MPSAKTQRFLIGTRTGTPLVAVVDALRNDTRVNVVRVIGNAGAPTMLVAEMEPAHAEQLRASLGPETVIEPDAALDSPLIPPGFP